MDYRRTRQEDRTHFPAVNLTERSNILRVARADDFRNVARTAKQPHPLEGRAVRWMLIEASSLLGPRSLRVLRPMHSPRPMLLQK